MPRYTTEPHLHHDAESCTGILITNLGTPDEPTPASVRKYLAEFLWDPRVIEKPRWLWWLALHGVILRIRPAKAARAYKKIWTDQGSPLLSISRDQVLALQNKLEGQMQGNVKVVLGMRYGTPSIASALEELKQANAKKILIFPLYPQYSATTTASAFDAVADVFKFWRRTPEMRMINDYHDHPDYIKALVISIKNHWKKHGRGERLLFSFHGLPHSYVAAGDPYRDQCKRTAKQVADALHLSKDYWFCAFQSRFGPEEWIKPYTDYTLKAWARSGIKSVNVISPGFSADCLETLEENTIENHDIFLDEGGESYSYIPALNDSEEHIDALANIIKQHCQGW